MSIDGKLLSGVSVLIAVIESGSFAKAADALGITPSGVSRAIARLEQRLGMRLLHRTTQSLSLTDEGAQFYARVDAPLAEIESAASFAELSTGTVRGRLRVNVDSYFSSQFLAPRIATFLEQYPDLNMQLIARDHLGDMVGEGFDVAIRFGQLQDSSLTCRQLCMSPVLTVASPEYLKRRGRPKSIQDLANHACLDFRDPLTGRAYEWEFRKRGKIVVAPAKGQLMVNEGGTMMAACLAGAGIAQILGIVADDHLASGRLVQLFPDWAEETFPLYLLYPSRKQPPAKIRAFIDFCIESIQ